MTNTCFIEKLEHYLPLTDRERRDLSVLEDDPKSFRAGTVIYAEDEDSADILYVVQQGRLHSSALLANGRRTILKTHFPGDMMGTASIAFEKAAATVVAAVDSRLCRIPRKSLTAIFRDHPRIAALFYAISMLENVALNDRLKSIGRTDGKSRIGALILDTICRIRVADRNVSDTVELKMTQSDIADAVGLTQVHVNRLMQELKRDGLIEQRSGKIRLLDEGRLVEMSHYTNRYHSVATDWFPAPAPPLPDR